MKSLRETIRKLLQESMLERGYVARRIRDINAYVPEIARMLCSGDEQQIYQAKEQGDKYMTVIVEPYGRAGFSIEIITRAYAGEQEVIDHFLDAIEESQHATLYKGSPKAVGKPKTVGLEHHPYEHEYQQYTLKMSVKLASRR
tara:strand:- start:18 stop:446 length:429 start_codon:yes stop_codon:yes gene_type:complete